ncbi:MAG: hypothetical protein LBF15_00005 [Candidatus Peribacteria bacterium]|jgi:hypothetical protein|nr:hypothetical protein [Candidatus Peribacteria bacterium]
MNKNFKKSEKIICFDENTRNELVEKFDISELKIHTINGFFPDISSSENEEQEEKLNINIKAKYSINHDEFFIYSG